MARKRKKYTFTLEPEAVEKLEEMAQSQLVPVNKSRLLQYIIEQFYEQQKKSKSN